MFEGPVLWQCNNRLGRGQRQKKGDGLGDHCIYQEKMTVTQTRVVAREVLRNNQLLDIEMN